MLIGLVARTPAQAPQIAWQPDYDAAFKQAAAEKKPLFIVFLMNDEVANDEVATSHLRDPEVVALTKNMVSMIACLGGHDEAAPSGTASQPAHGCSRFGAVTCAQHQQIESKARDQFMDSPRVATPQFLVVAPDGKTILLRHVYLLPVADLVSKLKVALAIHDPVKGAAVLSKVRAETDEILKQADGKNSAKRQEALQKLATSDDPRVIDFLIKQTAESVDETKRLEAVQAMGTRGNGKVLPVLHKLLTSGSNQLKIAVARALESLGMPESAPSILAAIRKESKTMVRARLVAALVACDAITPTHRAFIVGMIKSTALTDRLSAIRASGKLRLDDDLKKALLAAASDTNTPVRGAAYWALAKHNVAEAETMISKALPAEKNEDVKNIGTFAVCTIGGKPYSGPDPDSAVSKLFGTVGLY
jgi:hypothetical protein